MKITKTEAFEVLIQLMSNDHDYWGSDIRPLIKRHGEKDVEQASEFLYAVKNAYKDLKFKEETEDRKRQATRKAKLDKELDALLDEGLV